MSGPELPKDAPVKPQVPVRTPNRTSVVLVVFALLIAFLVIQGTRSGRQKSFLPPGTQAPDVQFERYGGGTVALSQLRGKVVMLDFWATWCPPCIKEMPHLLKLAKEYEARGVVFLAASRDDPSEAKAAVGIFIARRTPALGSYAAFADPETAWKFRVKVLPTLYFLDREGRVVHANSGYATEAQLRERLESTLRQ